MQEKQGGGLYAPRFFRMDRMTNVEIKEEVYELKSRQWLQDALER